MNHLNLTIISELDHIRLVENFIESTIEEFKLSEKLKGKIMLAIVEAVNNSILYGNKQNPQKLVSLTVVKNREKVIFTVEDEGEGFDFHKISNPTLSEHLGNLTGRGLYLMAHLTDELQFTKNGAKVTLIFLLTDEIYS